MKIGVVGLWHLGCVLMASWLKLGKTVVGIDFDEAATRQLSQGKAPLYEPGLDEALQKGLLDGKLQISTHAEALAECDFVFLAYDTPVDENDCSDLTSLELALQKIKGHLSLHAVLIVSSQVPVGTCRQFQEKLDQPVVCSPENLRLGEAIGNYLNPGHIVIGADLETGITRVSTLFSSIPATLLKMDLASAEMTKHALNSFLGVSITFANQLFEACAVSGADFHRVAAALKQDPRIGQKAYLKSGVGFSGGTLGRDLQILSSLNQKKGKGVFPLFGDVWKYNKQIPRSIVYKIGKTLQQFKDKKISLLGLTYKAGTSTLRRSVPLEMAADLLRKGALVQVYDPKANYQEAQVNGMTICQDAYAACAGSDFVLVLTEWPEFKELDFERIGNSMREKRLFDPYGFFYLLHPQLRSLGFKV